MSEPAGRGLSGFLIVDEKTPPAVDRDVTLLAQDPRLQDDGSLMPFGQTPLAAAGGRLGNLVTVNGRPVPARIEAPPGARIVLFAGSPKMADVLAGRGGRWYRRIGNIDWLRAAWDGDGPEAGGRA